MKLYPRKLHSVADLKAEKRRILQLHDVTEKEEWFSVNDLTDDDKKGKQKKKNTAEAHQAEHEGGGLDIMSIIASLTGSGLGWETIADLGLPLLSRFTPKIKRTAFRISKEILFGYAKWKAIEIGFRLVKDLDRKKREKRYTK